jgi:hypothetical protein
MLLGWMEKFRVKAGLPAECEAYARLWKESLMSRPRVRWQQEQHALANGVDAAIAECDELISIFVSSTSTADGSQ